MKKLFRIIPLLMWLLTPIDSVASQSVRLAWIPSPDAEVTNYRIYYGVSSRTYTNYVMLGNVTNATVTGLEDKVTYYFTATALNANGLESDPSNEVAYTIPDPYTFLTYIGVRLEWWTNLNTINQQAFMLTSFTNSQQSRFYRASLIITNTLNVSNIVDLKSKLDWWTTDFIVSSQMYDLKSFTNSVMPFCRTFLIVTNNPF